MKCKIPHDLAVLEARGTPTLGSWPVLRSKVTSQKAHTACGLLTPGRWTLIKRTVEFGPSLIPAVLLTLSFSSTGKD